MPCRREP